MENCIQRYDVKLQFKAHSFTFIEIMLCIRLKTTKIFLYKLPKIYSVKAILEIMIYV